MSGGYIRSRSNGTQEAFKLRSDVGGKSNGVTTVCESDMDADRDMERGFKKSPSVDIKRTDSTAHINRGGWNTSESVLVDGSDDDVDSQWAHGIRKTVVHTQTMR